MRIYLSLIIFLILKVGYSQPQTSTNNTSPSDEDSIYYFEPLDDFDDFCEYGPKVGDTVPNFTLYDFVGNKFVLQDELKKKKPILLIAGSYTCPSFRSKLNSINRVVMSFGNVIDVYVIYEMEAHPIKDTNIYLGHVEVKRSNKIKGILYDQPKTYGERKEMIEILNENMMCIAPILIDDPKNSYLNHFGPAPNNLYLIDTNSTVRLKHCHMNSSTNIVDQLRAIFPDSLTTTTNDDGIFTFELNKDSIVKGAPESLMMVNGVLTNIDSIHPVTVDIYRESDYTDSTWTSAMCLKACLSTSLSLYSVRIPPNSSRKFTFYIFAGETGTEKTKLTFRNRENKSNVIEQTIIGKVVPTKM